MPVRFDGKKDLIGMVLLLCMPALIAMVIALFMAPNRYGRITLLLLIVVLSAYLYHKRKKPKA